MSANQASIQSPEDYVIQPALRHVVYPATVAPVLDVSVRFQGLDDYLLPGLAQRQHEEYLKSRWYLQRLAQSVSVYGGDHAAAQAFLNCTQENRLSRDAMVAAK